MAETEASLALVAIHARLLVSLREIEAAGEFAAAAHLAAAMDVIEDRIELATGDRRNADAGNPIAALARHMTEQFGDRAQNVARRQLEEAHGPALLAWAAIINRMRA